ncbi:MAG: integrin alpha, partial [Myxococcota bacterium]
MDTGDTAAPADWSAVVGRRLDAEAAAFHPIEGGWLAAQSLMGLDARVSDDRVVLVSGTDEVTLRTRGVSRDGAGADFVPTQSGLGGCVATGEVDAEGRCIARLERVGDGLVEWWASTPGAVQVGWDIAAPPAGAGPLAIRVEVEGAGIQLDEVDGAATFVGPTREVGFSGLLAWDADGEPLDAWMEVDGDTLLVRVDDEGARYPVHVDPFAFTAGWSQSGSSSANFGRSVSVVGDVNFDGYDDVAVGAPAYSSSTGRVYVYHGSSSGLSTSPNVTLTGPATGSYFGRSVSGAGDVNADGFDDLVVGADGVSSGAGAAYVYYGSSTGLSTTAGVTLTGATASSFGYAVSAAGDVNGDRFGDVIVGAYTSGSPLNVGAAYVFHGATSGLSATAVTTLSGSHDYSSFGIDVAGAGDVNGDGYDDIVVGASTYSGNTGYVVIHHGAAAGVRTLASRRLTGAASIENFGASVAGAGDVNGDGYDDVVIGAWGRSSYYGGVEVYH